MLISYHVRLRSRELACEISNDGSLRVVLRCGPHTNSWPVVPGLESLVTRWGERMCPRYSQYSKLPYLEQAWTHFC